MCDEICFHEYFPQMCYKYGCGLEIPVIQYVHQGDEVNESSETNNIINEINDKYNEAVTTYHFNPPGTTKQRKSNRIIKTSKYNKRNDNVYSSCIYIYYRNKKPKKYFQKAVFQNVFMDLLFVHAMMDSMHLLEGLKHLEFFKCVTPVNVVKYIKQIICLTNIIDLCLDNCAMPEINFTNILTGTSSLKKLSLRKCNISDRGVKLIMQELHYPKQIEVQLTYLNLSSNSITDYGVKYIADALRTNRHLQILILADNEIGDKGCCFLSKPLKSFFLTSKETKMIESRKHLLLTKHQKLFEDYVKHKIKDSNVSDENLNKSIDNVDENKSATVETRQSLEKSTNSNISCDSLCLDELIENHLGPDEFPFRRSELLYKSGNIYCKGNCTLNTLNIAFNYIGSRGISSLIDVIQHQLDYQRYELKDIFLEGNPNVKNISEYHTINTMRVPNHVSNDAIT